MAQLYGLSPTMPNDSSSLFEQFGRGFGESHGIIKLSTCLKPCVWGGTAPRLQTYWVYY